MLHLRFIRSPIYFCNRHIYYTHQNSERSQTAITKDVNITFLNRVSKQPSTTPFRDWKGFREPKQLFKHVNTILDVNTLPECDNNSHLMDIISDIIFSEILEEFISKIGQLSFDWVMTINKKLTNTVKLEWSVFGNKHFRINFS